MHAEKIRTANIPAFRLEPKDAVIENMELWMEHVKPALDELTAHYES